MNFALHPLVTSMSAKELIDYCHIQNFTASPLVALLVKKLSEVDDLEWEIEELKDQIESLEKENDQGDDDQDMEPDFSSRTKKNPVPKQGTRSPKVNPNKPGPKAAYESAILTVLDGQESPVSRIDLVGLVQDVIGGGAKNAIYAAITKAVEDGLIVKIGSKHFQLRTKKPIS